MALHTRTTIIIHFLSLISIVKVISDNTGADIDNNLPFFQVINQPSPSTGFQPIARFNLKSYLLPNLESNGLNDTNFNDTSIVDQSTQNSSKDLSEDDEKLQNIHQLEFPGLVLALLSSNKSEQERQNESNHEQTKSTSSDVFIAHSYKNPPDGYISIPLPDSALNELKKKFFLPRSGLLDSNADIPVIAYIAPANTTLPVGHVAVPLPDSLFESGKLSESNSTSGP